MSGLDMFIPRLLFIFLSAVGSSYGQDVPLISGEILGILGKNVTFQTTIQASDFDDFLTISWLNQNTNHPVVTLAPTVVLYGPDYKGRVTLNSANGVLNIAQLTSKDTAMYNLNIVTKGAATRTGSIKLTVLEPVSGVTITSNMNSAVEFNSTVVLTCSAQGSGLTYKWLNGSAPVVADGTHVNVSNAVLTVNGVLRNDLLGPIYCVASNLEQATSGPFNLTVNYGPEKTAMTVTPGPGNFRVGSNVTFSCTVVSKPDPVIQWRRNGVNIGQTGPTLALTNIGEAMSGNYSCLVVNSVTMRQQESTPVTITVIAPIFGTNITGTTQTFIEGNSTGNLSCWATTGKAVKRVWHKNGAPLSPSDRVVFSPDMSTVVINPLQKEDDGEYRCILCNAVSEDSSRFRMMIKYGPEGLVVEGKHAVTEQTSITLKCVARSHPPASYAWKFNGTLIGVMAAEITIPAATSQNTGIYTCVASNAVTGKNVTTDFNLAVKEVGQPLEDPEGLTGGQIAGIIIGVIIGLILIIVVVKCMRRKKPIESPY